MRNRLFSGWRQNLVFVAVASIALTSFAFAGQEQLKTAVQQPQQSQGLQLVQDGQNSGQRNEPGLYVRSNYVWPYATGPVYGTLTGAQLHEQGVIRTVVGALQLDQIGGRLPLELSVPNKLGELGMQYFIIDIERSARKAGAAQQITDLIAASGGAVVGGMQPNALIARLTEGALSEVQAAYGVNLVVPMQPAFKLHPSIGRNPLPNPVKAASEVYDLGITLFNGEDARVISQQIIALGGTVKRAAGDTIFASVNRSQLGAIAAIQAVSSVYEELPVRMMGQESAITMQTGAFEAAGVVGPYHLVGIDGSGNGVSGTSPQVLMVIDSGAQLDAADLSDTHAAPGVAGAAHRKVVAYRDGYDFGGEGDGLGCDAPAQGGFTHGHISSATALGNATNIVDLSTGHDGSSSFGVDTNDELWNLDGVAPGAKLAFLDTFETPVAANCSDPAVGGLIVGQYYTGLNPTAVCPGANCPGSLQAYYRAPGDGGYDARVFNMSYGSSNQYINSSFGESGIDRFLFDKGDALVFVSAGNGGADANNDTIADLGSVTAPATIKNGLSIGASGVATNSNFGQESREFFSSVGPARVGGGIAWEADPVNSLERVMPQLMAPGGEVGGAAFGNVGIPNEFTCRSNDNDQLGMVECDTIQGAEGTSFAAPAAAGAALLVRDYFAQGFYPTGSQNNADVQSNVSGALVKAALIASADFLTFANVTDLHRFNNEQGYGRIELDNVLPLQSWAPSATGLIVADGGIAGGPVNISGLGGTINGVAGQTHSGTFAVCNPDEQLRISLVWMDANIVADGTLNTDLDLEVVAPSGAIYYGNYFTDDDNRNGTVNAVTEDCPDIHGAGGGTTPTANRWSLPICVRGDATLPTHDLANNNEGVFLSPDYDNDGTELVDDANPADDNQIELGDWTIRVVAKSGGQESAQRYAVVVAGAGCIGSSVRFDNGAYVCNASAEVTVNELDEPTDTGLNAGTISARTTVEVLDSSLSVVDTETGLTFTQTVGSERYTADSLFLTDQTARDPGNGVLDVRDGDTLRVTYQDQGPAATRVSESAVDCSLRITAGAVTFGQFGLDTAYAVNGGCERNARGLFEFGFPDRYLDEDEDIILSMAFASQETSTVNDVAASLRCVIANDALADKDCRPGTTNCLNPDRLITGPNAMTECPASYLSITNSPIVIQSLPVNAAIGVNFNIQMGATIPDVEEVEFVMDLTAPTSGKSGTSTAVVRVTLDADEFSLMYSTDFPTGGTQFDDVNGNELIEDPTTNIGNFLTDYRFETRVFSDMTATGKNLNLQSPWNFDLNNGGFTNGIGAVTDDEAIADTIAQWGEDKNFNNLLDGFCSRGKCIMNGANCVSNTQCGGAGGGTCIFTAEGWCNGVGGGTQCIGFDDPFDPDQISEDCEAAPQGGTCVLFSCTGQANCNGSGLPAGTRCVSELEDVDPNNLALDSAYGTAGGCGWQSKAPGTCSVSPVACYVDGDCPGVETCNTGAAQVRGGVWHTGRIGNTTDATCLGFGNAIGQCQSIETVSGDTGLRTWFELLVTPVMEQVDSASTVEIVNWAWNQAIDLEDSNVAWTWELDTDIDSINPADLFSDLATLNGSAGGYTPRGGASGEDQGNPDLTNGFSMFAPVFGVAGLSQNGTVGNNRVGKNSCYFEGAGTLPAATLANLGFALPEDDDLNNGHCPSSFNAGCTAFCEGGASDGGRCNDIAGDSDCAGAGDCTGNSAIHNDCGAAIACIFDNTTIDEYVTANGPIRNMDVFAFNGPDMRFTTLEDIYGDTGARWQAAIGMANFEKADPAADDPALSYGVGVDDMVVEWREVTLVADTTDCALSGACATLDTSVGTSFDGNSVLTITLNDSSPSNNDCDDNGDNIGGTDDTDCDNDGVADARITAKSENEIAGERVNLACTNPSGSTCPDGEYRGTLPVSATYDSVGILFVQSQGLENPVIEINYFDYDDGTGSICLNNVDPAAQGLVQAFTAVNLIGGNVALVGTLISDNGDIDPFADTNETIDMQVTLVNKTGIQLNNVVARLTTNDPKIDCIINTTIAIGTMAADDPLTALNEGLVTSTGAFTFRIANVNRVGVLDDFNAKLQVLVDADEFDTTTAPQLAILDLDLDASGGGAPVEVIESFEGGFGIFGVHNMDSTAPANGGSIPGIIGKGGAGGTLAKSDGYRCQYQDPDWFFSNSYGVITDCWLGATPTHANEVWWEITTDRSFDGNQSLHMGRLDGPTTGFTTPMAQLEAVETVLPIAMGYASVCSNAPLTTCTVDGECPGGSCIPTSPRAVWKHQISLVDGRTVNASSAIRSADGGVIHVQLANPANDLPAGDWIKVGTTANEYDSQREDNYTNCTFDPIDDGSDEDDFFDPADPFRRTGPSSTCFPEFAYTYIGDTDAPFSPTALGSASQGPALAGAFGLGSWIESVVDFARFKGQYVRLRMLSTGLKAGSAETYEQIFAHNPDPGDDGWFVDDFRVKDAITAPATLAVDTKANAGLAACPTACTVVTPSLVGDPAGALAAPGQVVEMTAAASTADRCVSGTLQHRFWEDVNGNGGAYQPGTDTLIRDWSDNPVVLAAPPASTAYAADTRCSTDTLCAATAYLTVAVNCPGGAGGTFPTIFGEPTKGTFSWTGAVDFAFAEGNLSTLDATYTASTTGISTGTSHVSTTGGSIWALFRTDAPGGGAFCNSGGPGTWSSGGAGQGADRDGGSSTLP